MPSGLFHGFGSDGFRSMHLGITDQSDTQSYSFINQEVTIHTFDLTLYKGQTIVVYLNVYNDGVANLKTAMYLDDVSIQVCGSTIQIYLPLLLKRR